MVTKMFFVPSHNGGSFSKLVPVLLVGAVKEAAILLFVGGCWMGAMYVGSLPDSSVLA